MLRCIHVIFLALTLALAACGSDSAEIDSADADTTSTTAPQVESTTTTTIAIEGKPEVVVPEGPAPTELEIDDLTIGTGKEAAAGDYLIMHYVGVRHSDGEQFDASWDRGETIGFNLGTGRVIAGWDQGIEGMREGGRRVLSIPPDLAYGATGSGANIPPDSALVFVVDLVGAYTPPTIENAPAPVTELEVVVLDEGDGEVIEAGTVIELHYRAVLQTTGEVFASSWESGQPALIEVAASPSQSIPAWDEGLLGRSVGDTVRMVVPPGLGINDPSGQIPEDATIITELTILSAIDRPDPTDTEPTAEDE